MIHNILFDGPKSLTFAIDLNNSITAISKYVIFAQSNPAYVVLMYVRGQFFNFGSVYEQR